MQFLSIAIFSVLCSVAQFRDCIIGRNGIEPADICSVPVCTAQERGLEVPAELCDDSLCQEPPVQDLTEVGKLYKYYKWNSELDIWGLNCSFGPMSIESPPDSTNSPLLTATRSSGINCSDITKFIVSGAVTIDFYRGKSSILKYERPDEEWSLCRPYSASGGPYIMRKCRTDPPPPPGKAFASISLIIPVDYNAESDADLQTFLGNYVVDWQQRSVHCY